MQFYINIIDLLFVMDYSKKLLEIFNTEIINIFKNTINKYCKNKRTPKYTTEYYLYNIILVLRKTSSWSSIMNLTINTISL